MNRTIKYVIIICVISAMLTAGVFVLTQPITFRQSLTETLTPEIISINGNLPSSVIKPRGGNVNLTIEVEVSYNHWLPIKDATVEIYGERVTNSNETDSDGIAILRLQVVPQSAFYGEGYNYLSMRVWKDEHLVVEEDAIRISIR